VGGKSNVYEEGCDAVGGGGSVGFCGSRVLRSVQEEQLRAEQADLRPGGKAELRTDGDHEFVQQVWHLSSGHHQLLELLLEQQRLCSGQYGQLGVWQVHHLSSVELELPVGQHQQLEQQHLLVLQQVQHDSPGERELPEPVDLQLQLVQQQ
jgi:hypothetical protein